MRMAIRRFPDKKKACLTLVQGSEEVILARFDSEREVRMLTKFLNGDYPEKPYNNTLKAYIKSIDEELAAR